MTKVGISPIIKPDEPISNVVELAKAAEAYGFHTLWMWDTPLSCKDPYIALTLAAINTRRILLGPCVSNPNTRHMSISVNSISTLDDLSEGRAILGFGNGGRGSMNALGFATPTVNEYRETLGRLCALMRGEEVAEEEGTYRIPSVRRRIPIHMAARGPHMLRVAGEFTDGALIAGEAQKELIARKIQRVRDGATAAGRDPGEVRINLLLNLSPHRDPQVAINELKPFVAYQVRRSPLRWIDEIPPEYAEIVRGIRKELAFRTGASSIRSEAELVPDELVKWYTIVGTEVECRERLADILTLQPDEVTFFSTGGDHLGELEKLAPFIPDPS